MSGYPDTETAGEHLRNIRQLARLLVERVHYEIDVEELRQVLEAIDARATAALEKIGEEPVPHRGQR